jgi:pimeloyl-ACP methyl ester carboxylesterase
MNILQANGIELAYDSFCDKTNEAILLIAGLGTQMIRWTGSFCEERAARGYRVIRFDNRDAGCSTHFSQCPPPDFRALAAALMAGQRPDVPYTLYDMAADAISLLDGLSIDRAHVVGRSMGGMVAQIMASDHPERVLSLTSIMSSTGNPELPQAAPDIMAMMTRPAPNPFSDESGFLAHSKDLAMKTHRALRGRVEKGKGGGGLCYGYRAVKKFDGNGEPIRADRENVPEEAEIVPAFSAGSLRAKAPRPSLSI